MVAGITQKVQEQDKERIGVYPLQTVADPGYGFDKGGLFYLPQNPKKSVWVRPILDILNFGNSPAFSNKMLL